MRRRDPRRDHLYSLRAPYGVVASDCLEGGVTIRQVSSLIFFVFSTRVPGFLKFRPANNVQFQQPPKARGVTDLASMAAASDDLVWTRGAFAPPTARPRFIGGVLGARRFEARGCPGQAGTTCPGCGTWTKSSKVSTRRRDALCARATRDPLLPDTLIDFSLPDRSTEMFASSGTDRCFESGQRARRCPCRRCRERQEPEGGVREGDGGIGRLPAPDGLPEVAVIGRSNIGKSVTEPSHHGQERRVGFLKPGTTQHISHIVTKKWWIIGSPDTASPRRPERRRSGALHQGYFTTRSNLAGVLLLVDASIPPWRRI